MTRTCDGCCLCCKVMPVVELNKGDEWCVHCNIGKGCSIYAGRPQSCADFVCQWLIGEDYLGDDLRPDRVMVVLTGTPDGVLIANCDKAIPLAWRRPKIFDLLRRGAQNRGHSLARAGRRFWVITADAEWEVDEDSLIRDRGEVRVIVPYLDGQPVRKIA